MVTLIEKKKKSVDNSETFSVFLADLSKPFDCLSLDCYLTNRKPRVKTNDKLFGGILFGVPRGSISEILLFNVFICDIFYLLEDFDIAIYADDSTPYNADKNIEFVVNNSQQSSSILFKWLNDHYMKVNMVNVRATTMIDNNYTESGK